ncbi:hypothetical protein ACJW30_05G128800 [Castanea mollissima]
MSKPKLQHKCTFNVYMSQKKKALMYILEYQTYKEKNGNSGTKYRVSPQACMLVHLNLSFIEKILVSLPINCTSSLLPYKKHVELAATESMNAYFYMKSAIFCFQANNALQEKSIYIKLRDTTRPRLGFYYTF